MLRHKILFENVQKFNHNNIEKVKKHRFKKKITWLSKKQIISINNIVRNIKKTLKSIIIRKITYIIEKHTLLFENHMKKRRCKSTKHVVHALIKFIIISWNKSKIVLKLFMNITKTFNNIIHVKLLHNLKKKKRKSSNMWDRSVTSSLTQCTLLNRIEK